jgi:hypothetical protein
MKTSSLLVALVIRIAAILSLLGTLAVPHAHAQVSFLQPLSFQGSSPEVDADFNRDGKLDIATSGTLLLGNGDGTFKTPINLSVSGNLVATADFNDDGNPDLLIASSQSTVLSVLLGNGDGTFQAPKSTNVGISFFGIIAIDVNGDGKPDVLGQYGTQVFVLLGNGDGTFKAGVPYSAGQNPYLMLTGDFNGDGKVDIATADGGYPTGGTIAVMLGNGDGTFQSPITSTGVQDPVGVSAVDANGDGKLDLIISDQSTGQTYTFLGNGNGTFQAAIVAASVAGPVGAADLSGDAKPADLIVGTGSSFAEVLLGNGDGTFTYNGAYATPFGGGSILIADFNNDGKLDVAIGGTMLLGNGNGTFNGQPVTPLPAASAAAAGDFNGDGNPDLAVTSSSDVDILLGNGTGSFTVAHTYALPESGYAIAAGDLNDDGKIDLAIFAVNSTNQDWSLAVMLGNGDGTFGAPTTYQQGQNSVGPDVIPPIVIADLRGDHKPYVLTLQDDSLVVFPNNGDGTFGSPVSYLSGSGTNGVVVADFNNDGKLDAAVSSSAGIGILLGNGDGTFQGATFTATAGNAFGIVTDDFNNDGKADLIVGVNGTGQVFLGNGNGTFTAVPGSLAAAVIGVADFNGDGNLDLVESDCPGTTSQFRIWCAQLGIGNGTFGNSITVTTGSDVTNGFNVIADFNRDQKPDIAIDLSPLFNPPGGVFMFLNTTPPAPGLTVSPTALPFPSQVAGTSSSPASVMLSNTGKGVLTVSGVKITGSNANEFSQTNNCTSVQPGANCTIKVVFAPAAAGNATASLSVTDNAVGSPQTVALSGTATAAPDFAIGPASGSSNSATIAAGQAASFNLTVSPAGSFSGAVSLSCAITPAVTPAPVCTLPASVNVTQGAAAPVAVKVSTTASGTVAGSISSANFPTGVMPVSWTMVLLASGLLFAGYRRRIRILAVPLIAVTFLAVAGCGGGGGGGSSSSTTTPGTPAGTYTATVTAKSGSLSHNTALTVIVQ